MGARAHADYSAAIARDSVSTEAGFPVNTEALMDAIYKRLIRYLER